MQVQTYVFSFLICLTSAAQAENLGKYIMMSSKFSSLNYTREDKIKRVVQGENTETQDYHGSYCVLNKDDNWQYTHSWQLTADLYVRNLAEFCQAQSGQIEFIEVNSRPYETCKVISYETFSVTLTSSERATLWYAKDVLFGVVKKKVEINFNTSNPSTYDYELIYQGQGFVDTCLKAP